MRGRDHRRGDRQPLPVPWLTRPPRPLSRDIRRALHERHLGSCRRPPASPNCSSQTRPGLTVTTTRACLAEAQTRWVMVPPGLRRAVAVVTNRPVRAERFTVRLLPVVPPMRSVTVRAGDLRVVARDMNRPVDALRETERARAMMVSPLLMRCGVAEWTRGRGRASAGGPPELSSSCHAAVGAR